MASFIDSIKKKAKQNKMHIVLPEGDDVRTLKAAQDIQKEGFAELTILGDVSKISESDFDLSGVHIEDPNTSDRACAFADELYNLRQAKGMDIETARDLVRDPLYFGVMMVKVGLADGMVAGATHATGDVFRPALQIIKCAPDAKLVSTFFVMDVPDCEFGSDGRFIFADCGLNVQTDPESLADIAVNSAHSWEALFEPAPKVAFLSHSTCGSAKNDDAQKVIEAVKIAKELDPSLAIDGELQLDAAICPEVAAKKCPKSDVAGNANVLIFPDLDAGNIGYKLVQRLAKAEAYGPITQGLNAPVNDLSRGCSAEDIVGVVAITCLQAQS